MAQKPPDPYRRPDTGFFEDDAGAEVPGGFRFPRTLDFNSAPAANGTDEFYAWLLAYANDVRDCGLKITDLGEGLPWKFVKEQDAVKCETLEIPGTKIVGVRHTSKYDGLSPDLVLDAYQRLNYTDIIDKFTTHVSSVENFPVEKLPGQHPYTWMQVTWTYDRIFPVFSSRDFVCLDYVDKENLMLVSKSCRHPGKPETAAPTCWRVCDSSLDAPTFRVPLLYFCRVVPDPNNPKSCTVVQFQWSDIAGIVPPEAIWESVAQFGFDSVPKFRRRLKMLPAGVDLGKEAGSDKYLANPLVPAWRQFPEEMIPELANSKEAKRGCFGFGK